MALELIGSKPAQIGKRLRDTRKRRALSQVDIAEACEISKAAVSLWERGQSVANERNLRLAAERLGVDLDWLVTGNRAKAPQDLPKAYDPALRRKNRRAEPVVISGRIPEMARGIGSGAGWSESEVHGWWVLPPTVTESLRIKPDKLRVYPVLTDGFAPMILRGSSVFVDLEQKSPIDGAVFAIDNGHGVLIRKLHIADITRGKLGLSAGNGIVETILSRDIKGNIIGRVIGQFAPL